MWKRTNRASIIVEFYLVKNWRRSFPQRASARAGARARWRVRGWVDGGARATRARERERASASARARSKPRLARRARSRAAMTRADHAVAWGARPATPRPATPRGTATAVRGGAEPVPYVDACARIAWGRTVKPSACGSRHAPTEITRPPQAHLGPAPAGALGSALDFGRRRDAGAPAEAHCLHPTQLLPSECARPQSALGGTRRTATDVTARHHNKVRLPRARACRRARVPGLVRPCMCARFARVRASRPDGERLSAPARALHRSQTTRTCARAAARAARARPLPSRGRPSPTGTPAAPPSAPSSCRASTPAGARW